MGTARATPSYKHLEGGMGEENDNFQLPVAGDNRAEPIYMIGLEKINIGFTTRCSY
jgi:hypothetical protein